MLALSVTAWYVLNPLPRHSSGCGNPGFAHILVGVPFVAVQVLNLCVLYSSKSVDPGVHLVFAAALGAALILLVAGIWLPISAILC